MRRAAALLLALLLAGCGQRPSPAPPVELAELRVVAPDAIAAGQPLALAVSAPGAPDGTPVIVTLLGAFGPRVWQVELAGGAAELRVPAGQIEAGVLLIEARAGGAEARASVRAAPGPPSGPQVFLAAPRTLPADDETEIAMAILIPYDAQGNAIADGTPARFQVRYPDLQVRELAAPVRGGIAWVRVATGRQAGQLILSGEVAGARALETDMAVTAGWPAPFSLSAEPASAPADGRQLIALRTEIIRDSYGNPMPDGTLVTFSVTMPDGTLQRIPAAVIDGRAEVPLQAARSPGQALVVASIQQVESRPLQIRFGSSLQSAQITIGATVQPAAATLTLTTDALVGPLGQLVPDGTPVTFVLASARGATQRHIAITEAGRAQLVLPLALLTPGITSISAEAGGATGELTIVVPAGPPPDR